MLSQRVPVRDRLMIPSPPDNPRGLLPQIKAANVRSRLRVFSGELAGRQIIMAAGTKTEFCRLTGVSRFAFDGETTDPEALRVAMPEPRRAFERRARTREPFAPRPPAGAPT